MLQQRKSIAAVTKHLLIEGDSWRKRSLDKQVGQIVTQLSSKQGCLHLQRTRCYELTNLAAHVDVCLHEDVLRQRVVASLSSGHG